MSNHLRCGRGFHSFLTLAGIVLLSMDAIAATSLPVDLSFPTAADYDGNFKISPMFNGFINWTNTNGGALQLIGNTGAVNGYAVFDTETSGGGGGAGATNGLSFNDDLQDFIMSFDWSVSSTNNIGSGVGALLRLSDGGTNGYALMVNIVAGGMQYTLYNGAGLTTEGTTITSSSTLPPIINPNQLYTYKVMVTGGVFVASLLNGTNILNSWSNVDSTVDSPGQAGIVMNSSAGVTNQVVNFQLWDAPTTGTNYYVSTNGNNAFTGLSVTDAWMTISNATKHICPGDTVYITAGTYRERIRPYITNACTSGTYQLRQCKKMTFAAYPGQEGQVIINGAWPTNTWTWNTNTTMAVGTNVYTIPTNTWMMSWTTNMDDDQEATEAVYSNSVYRRDMIIQGNSILSNVAVESLVTNGSFWTLGPSTGPTTYFMKTLNGEDPTDPATGIQVALSRLNPQFWGNPDTTISWDWLHVKGLTFRYACNAYSGGAIEGGNRYMLFESNVVEWSNASGIQTLYGTGNLFRANIVQQNGQEGISGSRGRNILLEQNQSLSNNWKHYSLGGEAGGGKFSGSSNVVYRYHTAAYNLDVGIWFDGSNQNCAVENSLCYSNLVDGIQLEDLSDHTLVRNNILFGNIYTNAGGDSGYGIMVSASASNTLVHNTIYGNQAPGIYFRNDLRGTAPGNNIYNNIVVDNNTASPSPWGAQIWLDCSDTNGLRDAAATNALRTTQLEGNIYYKGTSTYGTFNWLLITNDSIGMWQTETGQDKTNSSAGVDPLLVNSAAVTGWRLSTNSSIAVSNGVAIPTTLTIVAKDADWNDRPETQPDIGADQLLVATSETNGLVGYWKFDEGSGINMLDSSGNNRTLVATNVGVAWVIGDSGTFGGELTELGNSIDLTAASNGHVETAKGVQINLTTNYTIMAWINCATFPTGAVQATICRVQGNTDASLEVLANGELRGSAYAAGSGNWPNFVIYGPSHGITSNTWAHIAFTANVTNLSLYINGSLVSTGTIASTTNQVITTGQVLVGIEGHTGSTAPFNGMVDGLRLYNRVLSEQEIQSLDDEQ